MAVNEEPLSDVLSGKIQSGFDMMLIRACKPCVIMIDILETKN